MDSQQPQDIVTNNVQIEDSIRITRRSGWSLAFSILGSMGLVAAGVGVLMYMKATYENDKNMAISCILFGAIGAIQFFFLSFIVSVLTDIRWFLRPVVKAEAATDDPDADIKRRCNAQ
jgi:hypothetical protein